MSIDESFLVWLDHRCPGVRSIAEAERLLGGAESLDQIYRKPFLACARATTGKMALTDAELEAAAAVYAEQFRRS